MHWSLSPEAFNDLDAILAYVEEESVSPRVADKLLEDFEKAFSDLAAMPGMGWLRQDLTGPAFRWWRIHRYLILYDPVAKPLRIIRVIHGARDLPAIFTKDTGD